MRSIQFASYPKPLSAVCMGTQNFGSGQEDGRSMELLDQYYDMGGRFLDTANLYGRWSSSGQNESERVIGTWLRERQITDMVITSKCCHYSFAAKDVSRVNRKEAMSDLDSSRKTLGLDVIPIYLTHRDKPDEDVRVIVDFMVEMVEKGYITRFGFSNYAADRVQAAIDYMGADWTKLFVGVSNEWSLHEEACAAALGGHKDAPNGLIATDTALWRMHQERQIPLIPFTSSAHGFYTKLEDPDTLPAGEREVYDDLVRIAADENVSVHAVALAYILRSGVPAIPVLGVSSEKQLREYEDIARIERDLSELSPFRRMETPMPC